MHRFDQNENVLNMGAGGGSLRWPTVGRNVVRMAIVLLLILSAASPSAFGQFGKRKRFARGGGDLPGALGKMGRSQMRHLDEVLSDAIAMLSNKLPELRHEPGNFFGIVKLREPGEDEVGVAPPEPGQFGLYVLGALQSNQIRVLSDLAKTQTPALTEYAAKQQELLKKMDEVLKAERPNRTQERELQALGNELGVLEVEMGLAQATAFLDLNSTLNNDQREYLMLLRKSPDAGSLENPSVAKIKQLADRLDKTHRRLVLAMAERCCLFLTGTAAQNVPTLSARELTAPDSPEAERKWAIITALNPQQQAGLANLVTMLGRLKSDARGKRLQIATLFDTLKMGRRIDDRKLAAPGGALGKSEAALLFSKFKSINELQANLSVAQRAFIANNILKAP